MSLDEDKYSDFAARVAKVLAKDETYPIAADAKENALALQTVHKGKFCYVKDKNELCLRSHPEALLVIPSK